MQRILIASAVLGLVGCTPDIAAGLFMGTMSGGLGGGAGWRGNDPERMCAGATPGRAQHACLAAHGVVDSEPISDKDRGHVRENAEARATAARLELERGETATCFATTKEVPAEMVDHRIAPHLDRPLVANGIATVNAQVLACGASSAARGQVLVEVTVAARGCVVAVAIEATPDRELGACVATALVHARFAATDTGGAFRYPYKF